MKPCVTLKASLGAIELSSNSECENTRAEGLEIKKAVKRKKPILGGKSFVRSEVGD